MSRYDIILDSLTDKVDSGEMTLEHAADLLNMAEKRYMMEEDFDGGEEERTNRVLNMDKAINKAASMDARHSELGKKNPIDIDEPSETDITLHEAVDFVNEFIYNRITESFSNDNDDDFSDFSDSLTNTKLNVYEAYEMGEITESEKDKLLQIINEENYD